MGGRGATSGKGTSSGSGALVSATSVTVQSGDTLDLSKYPLKYGEKDAALTGKNRELIEDFENRHLKSKVEYGTLVDANGNVLIEKKGGSGSVSMPKYLYDRAEVMSHNHPRGKGEEGLLGGTFSEGDISGFVEDKTKTMRASAAEGTYSITKGANFDAKGLKEYSKNTEKAARQKYKDKNKAAVEDFKGNKISYDEYVSKSHENFNQYLVEKHNSFIEGQKKYGYTYTLERR